MDTRIRMLMTTEAVAELLGCTTHNVNAMVRAGTLKPVKTCRVYDMAEVLTLKAVAAMQPHKPGRPRKLTPTEQRAKARALRVGAGT